MLADETQPSYRVFLKPNQVGQAQTQQLPLVSSYGYGYPAATQIHIAPPAPPVASVAQTIRPVFNVIPNPGSADALRRVQNQMAAQRVAMSQLKENLGYIRQVVDGLKAELALQDSGKKAVTFKDMAPLKKYIDINRASIKTLQDKDRELDLQVRQLQAAKNRPGPQGPPGPMGLTGAPGPRGEEGKCSAWTCAFASCGLAFVLERWGGDEKPSCVDFPPSFASYFTIHFCFIFHCTIRNITSMFRIMFVLSLSLVNPSVNHIYRVPSLPVNHIYRVPSLPVFHIGC
mmetsp:Transcript_31040/g.83341  ORF Transcript_31040/g.83341 Transcript_31040/m.83341 type:complete len:287 (+) Transcript_31040:165-1025(+)